MIHETALEKSEFFESEIHLKIEQIVFILSAIEQGGQILDVWRNAQNPTALNSVFHNVFQGNDAHIHSLTDNVFRFFCNVFRNVMSRYFDISFYVLPIRRL